jgi:hypothetical protein
MPQSRSYCLSSWKEVTGNVALCQARWTREGGEEGYIARWNISLLPATKPNVSTQVNYLTDANSLRPDCKARRSSFDQGTLYAGAYSTATSPQAPSDLKLHKLI